MRNRAQDFSRAFVTPWHARTRGGCRDRRSALIGSFQRFHFRFSELVSPENSEGLFLIYWTSVLLLLFAYKSVEFDRLQSAGKSLNRYTIPKITRRFNRKALRTLRQLIWRGNLFSNFVSNIVWDTVFTYFRASPVTRVSTTGHC